MRTSSLSRLIILWSLLAATPSYAGVVLSGGITLVKEGGTGHGTASNIALGKTAFAKDEIGAAPHAISKVNDGQSGNSNSWIAGTQNSFVGINLGATALPVRGVAFARDNNGTYTDRTFGLYELQYTTTPNPGAATPEGSWTTVGTMDYQTAGGANFSLPSRRHLFNLPSTVMATGIRLKVNATTAFDLTCVDELEVYDQPLLAAPVLITQGERFRSNNLAEGKPAFAQNEIGVAPHTVSKLNNGLYGNTEAWIAGASTTFAGINLGSTPVTLNKVAFSRDHTGAVSDRWAGTYTFQYTTTPNPGASTPDADWISLGVVDYATLPTTGLFSQPARRHVWSFVEVQATGFRLKIVTTGGSAQYVALDEIELYDSNNHELNPPMITPPANVTVSSTSLDGAIVTYPPATVVDESAPAPSVTYSHPSGSAFPMGATTVTVTATDSFGIVATSTFTVSVTASAGGIFLSDNLAAGKTAFAKDEIGVAPHAIPNLNDGGYGNASSWIAGSADSFVGINLGTTPVQISQVAWGRDNTGAAVDRWPGVYTLQYTTVPNPKATTPDASWTTLSVVDTAVLTAAGTYPGPQRRHRWSFTPVMATGFRLLTLAPGDASTHIAIDELELYDSTATVPASGLILIASGLIAPSTLTQSFTANMGATTIRQFMIYNAGGSSVPVNVSLSGGSADAFILNDVTVPASLAAGATAVFTVSHSPFAIGDVQTVIVHVTGAAPAPYAITLRASGIDTQPPVISPRAAVTHHTTTYTSQIVTFEPAEVSDNYDPAPVVTYSHPSGSTFPYGLTEVTVTAVDDNGNTSTSKFTVEVINQLTLREQGSGPHSDNLAIVNTAFASYYYGSYSPSQANNGIYGLNNSWRTGGSPAFFGISFGSTLTTVSQAAWGHDNGGNSSLGSSFLAEYTLQYTTTPNPDANATWVNIGRVDYRNISHSGLMSEPRFRHLWSFPPVQATGIRLLMKNDEIYPAFAIDEFELYDEATSHELNAPFIANMPTVQGTSLDGSPVPVTYPVPAVFDDTDPAPVITFNPPAGTPFARGQHSVLVTATDMHGNAATKSLGVVVSSQGAPALVGQGGVVKAGNLCSGKTAFAKDEIGVAPHAISKVIDGLYGNASSWIPGSVNSFIGVNLGASPVTLDRVAWGRDNTGASTDRWSGLYFLEYTTTPNPNETTPDSAWTTIWMVDYTTMAVSGSFSQPSRRHLWSFAPVQATGFRLRMLPAAATIAIDEIELYNSATLADTSAPVIATHANVSASAPTGASMTVTYNPAAVSDDLDPAPVMTYSPPSGSSFSLGDTLVTITATDAAGNSSTSTFTVTVTRPLQLVRQAGRSMTNNLASGRTAFAKDVIGAAPHSISNLNNGTYGNPSSWLAGSASSFIGINLGAVPVTLTQVAFGRDNTNISADRWPGVYTLQYTTTPNPDASTPDAQWISFGVLDYNTLPTTGLFSQANRRHLWSFPALQATGFRMKIQSPNGGSGLVAIDELELYDDTAISREPPVISTHPNVSLTVNSLAGGVVHYSPAIAADDDDPAPVITYSRASGSLFPLGGTSVTITATDLYGNSSTSTFDVVVSLPAPVLRGQGGSIASGNLAAGAPVFSSDFTPGHEHALLNNGTYGDSSSWTPYFSFGSVGINFGATPVPISRVAFGRDNTGVVTDRWQAIYYLQFTTVPNPNLMTPDEAWTLLGTIDYTTIPQTGLFSHPARRHVWSFFPVLATGFRIFATSYGGSVGNYVAIDELELYNSPLEGWRTQHFGTGSFKVGLGDDYDNDGLTNLEEFAFGFNPTKSRRDGLSYQGNVIVPGLPVANPLSAMFVRRKDYAAAGLTYTVEMSPDLSFWNPATTPPTVLADDGLHEVLSVPFPPAQDRYFFRVKVTASP
ncbi:HYR domain-containing protein [Brevifollis gellanilyticus]|uniref:HYR domain-containing protein n=1 Tax=Brevifollis gellanilyticus TaxID=748831 RepID=A0A512MFG5_9BACT|nr:HYR domain-containing protein [Brevifollis gellanilyticus]GEP45446.1 hypothetical protein BGE01nite_47370 [Brevifollis gellanilyticus]